MRVWVYLLLSIAIIKIFLDIQGESVALYSVFLDNAIFAILLVLIARTYFKQREGKREQLQRKLHELNQLLNENRL